MKFILMDEYNDEIIKEEEIPADQESKFNAINGLIVTIDMEEPAVFFLDDNESDDENLVFIKTKHLELEVVSDKDDGGSDEDDESPDEDVAQDGPEAVDDPE